MSAPPRGAHVAPLQAALLQDPVSFLSAEHARQTVLLGHLERVARDPVRRGARVLAAALLGWLTTELPLHIADEERSLYPRLAGHDRNGVLPRLQQDHRRDQAAMAELLHGLRCAALGQMPGPEFGRTARDFASGHRRHLQLEEAEVTPLAHAVLDAAQLRALAAEMLQRRGRAA